MAETAAYLARKHPRFERVVASNLKGPGTFMWAALPLAGARPTVTIDETGVPHTGTEPDDARPIDLLRDLPDELVAELAVSLKVSPDLRHETALITGAAPNSIGAELAQAAPARRRQGRDRDLHAHARAAALLPRAVPHERRPAGRAARRAREPRVVLRHRRARAVAATIPGGGRRGRDDLRVDPLTPTILAPFAALSTTGDANEAGAAFETAIRLQLLGVQRLIGQLTPRTVLLPLSPNHGAFGSDGPYGETKAALEVLLQRAQAEPWGANTTIIAPKIGWVRGTNLMRGNDAIAPLVEERLDVRTFAADEMAWLLTSLLVTQPRGRDRPDRRHGPDRRPARRAAAARRRAARPLRPHRPRPHAPPGDRAAAPTPLSCRRCPAPAPTPLRTRRSPRPRTTSSPRTSW